MTYSVELSGIPGVAVRIGRALETWGRRAARRPDREFLQREIERRSAIESRLRDAEVHGLLHRSSGGR
jgi:hypothetical protein